VFRVALSPRMNELLSPQMVEFDSKLEKEFSKFILANSITLTPGTISLDVRNNQILIHALTKEAADGVLSGDMGRRVAALEAQD